MEYPSVKVTVLGPSLLREAVEVLLRTLPQGAGSGTPGAPPPVAFMVGNGHAAPRIRERNVPAQSHVIVLVGPDWQDRVAAERRNQPRGTPAPAPPRPDPRYVLVTNERNADFYGARRLAITAFIGDDEPPEVLAQGIASAAAGRSFCSPQLLPTLIDAVGGAPIATSPPENGAGRPAEMEAAAASSASGSGVDAELSSREHEVTLHAARGLSNEQIAVYLKISVPTVKYHLQRAFRKLGVARRTQLAVFLPYLNEASQALLGPAPDGGYDPEEPADEMF